MSATRLLSNTVALAHTPTSASVKQTTASTPAMAASTVRHAPPPSSVAACSTGTSTAGSTLIAKGFARSRRSTVPECPRRLRITTPTVWSSARWRRSTNAFGATRTSRSSTSGCASTSAIARSTGPSSAARSPSACSCSSSRCCCSSSASPGSSRTQSIPTTSTTRPGSPAASPHRSTRRCRNRRRPVGWRYSSDCSASSPPATR